MMPIDSNEWTDNVAPLLDAVDARKVDLLAVARGVIGRQSGKVYSSDPLYISCMNRVLKNLGGFNACVRERRYNVAALIVRGHLDTLCRLHGMQVAANQKDFETAFLQGKIRSVVDGAGAKLTDRCLVEHLSKKVPWVASMYDALSGHAHLSNTHFLATFAFSETDEHFSAVLSEFDTEVPVDLYQEMCEGFLAITDLLQDAFTQHEEQGRDP